MLLRFKKKVTKYGVKRRIIEVPKDYYTVLQVGDEVIIEVKQ